MRELFNSLYSGIARGHEVIIIVDGKEIPVTITNMETGISYESIMRIKLNGIVDGRSSVGYKDPRRIGVLKIPSDMTYKRVIFNNPATVVFWMDGTKTVVKAENEDFDPEKGLAMAIAKKVYGNTGSYYNQFKKHIQPYHKQLLSDIRKLHDQGKSEKEISDALGIGSVAKLRNLKAKLIREEKAE